MSLGQSSPLFVGTEFKISPFLLGQYSKFTPFYFVNARKIQISSPALFCQRSIFDQKYEL